MITIYSRPNAAEPHDIAANDQVSRGDLDSFSEAIQVTRERVWAMP